MSYHLHEESSRPGSFFPQVRLFVCKEGEERSQLLVRVLLPGRHDDVREITVEGLPERFVDAEQAQQLGIALQLAAEIMRTA